MHRGGEKIRKPIITILILLSFLVCCNAVSAIQIQDNPGNGLVPPGGSIPNMGKNNQNNSTACNTNLGENISVTLSTENNRINVAKLNFTEINIAGNTTINEINSSSVPETPSEFILSSSSAFYEIKTTATYTGPIIISLNYSGMTFDDESSLKLLHYDNTTDTWVDCTTNIDTVNKIIYGLVHSLSPFAILEKTTISLTNNQNDPNQNNQNTVNAATSYSYKQTKNTLEAVNAANTSTGMQTTGGPIVPLTLAVLSVLGGLAAAWKKQ